MPDEFLPNQLLPDHLLIDRLVAGLQPVRPRTNKRDGLLVAGICVLELALFLLMGAMRPDMPVAMRHPSFWWKLTSLGLIAAVSGTASVFSFHPAGSPRRGLRWVLALAVACLAVGWALDASRAGSAGWASLQARLDWRHGMQCFTKMVLLALPAVAGLSVLMRRGAPTDRAGTAWSVGIAAAAWGAFVFVFACPSDDPLYIAFWYMLACLSIAVLARLLLPVLARW